MQIYTFFSKQQKNITQRPQNHLSTTHSSTPSKRIFSYPTVIS